MLESRRQPFLFEGLQRRSTVPALFGNGHTVCHFTSDQHMADQLQDLEGQVQHMPLGGALKMFPAQHQAPSHSLLPS